MCCIVHTLGPPLRLLYFHYMEDRTIFCSQCHSPLHVRTVGNIEDPVFILYFVCNCERQSPAEIEALTLAA